MHKAVFLDKDGTLIEDVPHNIDPGKIKFTAGCEKGLKLLQSNGYKLIIISNQPGIALGYFTSDQMERFGKMLFQMVVQFGVHFSDFYYCPHHTEGTVQQYRVRCLCRKPEPGLILKAAQEHDIDLAGSWFIGDILNDVEAGRRAGCKTVLIDNGKETEWFLSRGRIPHYIVADMEEAAAVICTSQRISV